MATRSALQRLWVVLAPWWACLACLACLGGCGPGVGGTGTGTETEPPPGAANVALRPLCQSNFADLLSCGGVPGSPTPALGTTLAWLADSASSRNALLRIEGNAADLEIVCAGVQFSGTWGQVAGQAPRFHGVARSVSGAATQVASLSVSRSGAGVAVQLFSASGQALTDVIALDVVAAPPPLVSACP